MVGASEGWVPRTAAGTAPAAAAGRAAWAAGAVEPDGPASEPIVQLGLAEGALDAKALRNAREDCMEQTVTAAQVALLAAQVVPMASVGQLQPPAPVVPVGRVVQTRNTTQARTMMPHALT